MSDINLTPEEIEHKKQQIESGELALHSVPELLEIFGVLPEALGTWVEPIGAVVQIIQMVYEVIKAMETEERGAGFRGTAYGTMYAALGMGQPSHTCQGSLHGDDQDKLDTESWTEGAHKAYSHVSGDVKARNKVIVRIAKDGNDPGTTLNHIFQQLCADSGDHQLAQAYSSLPWPGPQ